MNSSSIISASQYGVAIMVGAYTANGMAVPLATVTVILAVSATYMSRRSLRKHRIGVGSDLVVDGPVSVSEFRLDGLANLLDHLDRNLINAALSLEDLRDPHASAEVDQPERRRVA